MSRPFLAFFINFFNNFCTKQRKARKLTLPRFCRIFIIPYFKPYLLISYSLNIGKKEEQRPQVVFHTDQGAVYSSRAFCHAHEHYNILRSMSRGGTPTDNPIIEALNGWIKEELYLDYGLADADILPDLLNQYVFFFNNYRPAAALGYKSPVQYKTELGFVYLYFFSVYFFLTSASTVSSSHFCYRIRFQR